VRTLRALYNARDADGARASGPIWKTAELFMEILKPAQRPSRMCCRLMNDSSVLGRYLWVFRRIVGQMQHDLFHVYTVDQHILMVRAQHAPLLHP
jgi:[protein-PII] uridylyltransferase